MPRPRKTSAAKPSPSRAPSESWPDTRARLDHLARNLWWTWNPPARRLLESMDPRLWHAASHNPIATLNLLSETRAETLAADPDFIANLDAAENELDRYLNARTWFERTAKGQQKKMLAAYFCMEYGLHECLSLYAGGLGILAGDHVKSASDLGVPIVCVGVLWKHGYYRQELTRKGETRVVYPSTDFEQLPIDDTGKVIEIPIGPRKVLAKVWCLTVGRVPIYLLDTDVNANSDADRALTHYLYRGGDAEYRIRQELLLGIGGLHALDALGIQPTAFHLNEGHAAFAPLERVRRLVASGEGFDDAVAQVREHSVFTTHTPVPEGNDRFEPSLLMKYLGHMPDELGLSGSDFLALGREDPDDQNEPFCMTVLALLLSERCNGVAALHGDTSRRMWMKTFDATQPEQVPIGHVTNGVHPESWIADEARPFYDKYLKPKWIGAGPENDWWKGVSRVPAGELWNLRQLLRRRMIAWLRQRVREEILTSHTPGQSADLLVDLCETFDEDALTIGFARRFATYKRAPLIFKDTKRLAKIMGHADRPVQFLFAGKAHPQDTAGQEFVRQIHEYSRKEPFRGRVYLIQNYDTNIGRMLTSGCDVWLNNPIRPMEASGTSGMKPPLNLGINCSILDGWWPEGYNKKNGWAIGGKQFKSRKDQDAYDAEAIYTTLEKQVVPMFYKRGKDGIPREWCRMMAESMKSVCAKFSSHRMVAEYVRDYYLR
jgi:starch phosphorylase